MKVNNRLASVIGNIKEMKEANLMMRVTSTFQRVDDGAAQLQRCLQILNIDPERRTIIQAKFMQKYFEKEFAYFSKIKGQLPDDLFIRIYKDLVLEKVGASEVVFNIGDIGRKMYFIIEGEVAILIPMQESPIETTSKKHMKKFEDLIKQRFSHCKLIAIKSKFDHFGEIAIEQHIPRTASVVTKTDCTFATLSYDSYQRILGQFQEKILQDKLDFIQRTPPFKNWSTSAQLVLLHSCQEMNFEPGSFIYKRGQKGDQVYLIKEGEILVEKWEKQQSMTNEGEMLFKKNTKVIGLYSTGQIFGDYEVYQTKMKSKYVTRVTSAQARVRTYVLALSISQYIDNMRLNQQDRWIGDYYEQKFTKKWLTQPDWLINNIITSPQQKTKQYIKSREEGRQAFKISVSNNYDDFDYKAEFKESTDTQMMSPTQLHNESKRNKAMRKFLSLQGNLFKVQKTQEGPSMDTIIRQIKHKVMKSRDFSNESVFDPFQSKSKFYSVKKQQSTPKVIIGLSFKSFREADKNKSKFLD